MAETLAILEHRENKVYTQKAHITGTSQTISLGSNWGEAIVYVYYGGFVEQFTLVENGVGGTYAGGFWTNTASNTWHYRVVCTLASTNTIKLSQSIFGNSDVASSTHIYVYTK